MIPVLKYYKVIWNKSIETVLLGSTQNSIESYEPVSLRAHTLMDDIFYYAFRVRPNTRTLWASIYFSLFIATECCLKSSINDVTI
jgi:hypothetical protein